MEKPEALTELLNLMNNNPEIRQIINEVRESTLRKLRDKIEHEATNPAMPYLHQHHTEKIILNEWTCPVCGEKAGPISYTITMWTTKNGKILAKPRLYFYHIKTQGPCKITAHIIPLPTEIVRE